MESCTWRGTTTIPPRTFGECTRGKRNCCGDWACDTPPSSTPFPLLVAGDSLHRSETAAIHRKAYTGDVARRGRRQERDCGRDLLRRGEAAHRNGANRLLLLLRHGVSVAFCAGLEQLC